MSASARAGTARTRAPAARIAFVSANRARPFAVWIACLAILTGTLAPSIGQAVAAIRGWPILVAELCSANRHGRVVIWAPIAADTDAAAWPDGSGRPDGPLQRSGAGGAHCPACLGSADPWGPPPAKAPSFAVAATPQRLLPALAAAPANASQPWTPANPRAPPASA